MTTTTDASVSIASNAAGSTAPTAGELTTPQTSRNIERLISKYPIDHVLFSEGDPGSEMFIVLRGEVHIHKSSGGLQVQLGVFRAGDFFGEMALVEAGVRTATATVTLADTELVAVNQARFVYLVSQQPAFALSVMRMMGRRVEEMNQRLASMGEARELAETK